KPEKRSNAKVFGTKLRFVCFVPSYLPAFGHGRRAQLHRGTMRQKIRVGIVGVGNCASALEQGASFYSAARSEESPPGLMNLDVGGYRPADIEFAAAFDVDAGKVGRDLSEAIFAPPNNTIVFDHPTRSGVRVLRGPTLDGIGKYMADEIEEAEA